MKWALIGASDIASTRMVQAIRDHGGEITAVVSGSSARAEQFASAHGIPLGTTDLTDGLADCEAVYISSVNDLHAPQAITALDAGKHVLCEKPMALSLVEAQGMLEASQRNNRVLALNHHLPGSPLHVAIRESITHHKLGEILSVRINHAVYLPERLRTWRLSAPPLEGGGVIFDITCHDLSVILPLLGTPPTRVFAAANPSFDSQSDVMTIMEFSSPHQESKTLVYTHDSFESRLGQTSIEVQCTNGHIRATDAMTQDTAGTITITTDSYTGQLRFEDSKDIYAYVLEDFSTAIKTGTDPLTSGSEGMAMLETLISLDDSLNQGIYVELPRN